MQSYKKTKRGRKRWGTNNRSAPDVLSWKQMHCYHLVSNVSGPDWSLICHSHRKKSKSLSNCSFFFFPTSSPFIFSTVFLSSSITSVWQVTDGLWGENNVLWPSVLPSSSAPGSNSLSQQAVGGPAATPPPTSLSAPPPPAESIAVRHHTNDPLKSMHHSTVHHQQWPAVRFMAGSEGAPLRWRVVTGKYNIEVEEGSEAEQHKK